MIEYINACSFKNKGSDVVFKLAKKDYFYYYVNFKGDLSYKYQSLSDAKEELKLLFSNMQNFKMLI